VRKLKSIENACHQQKNGSKGANSEVPTEEKLQPCSKLDNTSSGTRNVGRVQTYPNHLAVLLTHVAPKRLRHWQEVINAASDRVSNLRTSTELAALSMFMRRSEFLARASARAAGSALVVITWRSNCAYTLSECLIEISFR